MQHRALATICLVSALLLLVFNAFFVYLIGSIHEEVVNVAQVVANQRLRQQVLVKDVLAYPLATTDAQRSQYVAEIQAILPALEQAQMGLANGSPALDIPAHHTDAFTTALANAQTGYIYTDTAGKAALQDITQNKSDDLAQQRAILLQYDAGYRTSMYALNQVLLQDESETIQTLTGIVYVLKVLLAGDIVWLYVLKKSAISLAS